MAKKSFSAGVTKTGVLDNAGGAKIKEIQAKAQYNFCLLYTSDAADD